MADTAAVSPLIRAGDVVNSGCGRRPDEMVASASNVDTSSAVSTKQGVERVAVVDGWRSTTSPSGLPDKTSHQSGTDGTSSGVQSPDRIPRAHSVAGRQPSYAQPTLASLLRMSRSNDLLDGAAAVPMCPRCRPRSASPPVLFRQRDLYRPLRVHRLTMSMSRPRTDISAGSASKSSTQRRPITPSDKPNKSLTSETRTGRSLSSLTSTNVPVPASGPDVPVTSPPATRDSATVMVSRTLVKSMSADKAGKPTPTLRMSASTDVRHATTKEPTVIKSKSSTNVKKSAKSRTGSADKELTKKDVKMPSSARLTKDAVNKDTSTVKKPDNKQTVVESTDVDKTSPVTHTDSSAAEEEYKAKLAEKRRLAREKAELEAAQQEERRLQQQREEEERARREEEEERAREAEELRLAEELKAAEAERLRQAVAEEQKRRQLEEEKLEAERQQRMEAERIAREEAQRLEAERQAKLMRDEEEKLERKKRLENIMKRVKSEDSTTKIDAVNGKNPPPSSVTVVPSPDGTPLTDLSTLSTVHSDIPTHQFKSPRLQQLLAGRTAAAGTPVKPTDNLVPADAEEAGAVVKSDKTDETLSVSEV